MNNKCSCYNVEYKRANVYNPLTGQPFGGDIEVDTCWGTRERDQCSCGGDKTRCSFYVDVREEALKTISAEDAIYHYQYGVDHDIFSGPVVAYAQLSIEALEKQISKKPIHIHEEHSEHLWRRDDNGEIDTSAWSAGYCNGPICDRCHHSECEFCNPEWETKPTEPCVVDRDICPVCCSDLKSKNKYCHECGQALDWSD